MKYNIHRFDEITSNGRHGYKFLLYRVNKTLVLRFALLVTMYNWAKTPLEFRNPKAKVHLRQKHGRLRILPLKLN